MQLTQILLLALLASLAIFMRRTLVTSSATVRLRREGWPSCLHSWRHRAAPGLSGAGPSWFAGPQSPGRPRQTAIRTALQCGTPLPTWLALPCSLAHPILCRSTEAP